MRLFVLVVTVVVIGLLGGFLCFRPSSLESTTHTPISNTSDLLPIHKTPEPAPTRVDEVSNEYLNDAKCKEIFQLLEEAKQHIAEQREVIRMLGTSSSYEAARCLQLLDRLESCRARLRNQIIQASNGDVSPPTLGDVRQFVSLGKQYEAAGVEYKKALRRK